MQSLTNRLQSKKLKKLIELERFADVLAICKKENIDSSTFQEQISIREKESNTFFLNHQYEESIHGYITLIGVMDPAIIIAKFYDQKLYPYLVEYLISLLKLGYGNQKYTKLLFNLFVYPSTHSQLESFISDIKIAQEKKKNMQQIGINRKELRIKEPEMSREEVENNKFLQNFDADIAIETLNKNSMLKEAHEISQAIGISMHLISAMIFNDHKYTDAAQQIFDHYDEPIGRSMLMKYGPELLRVNVAAGRIITQTATLIWQNDKIENDKEYISLLWGHPKNCYTFLKSIIKEKPTELFADTLISLLIPRKGSISSNSFFGNPSIVNAEEALSLISDEKLPINVNQMMSICADAEFISGLAALLTRIGKPKDALTTLLQEEATSDLVDWILKVNPPLDSEDFAMIFEIYVKIEKWETLVEEVSISNSINFFKKVIHGASLCLSFTTILNQISKNEKIPASILQINMDDTLRTIQDQIEPAIIENEKLEQEINSIENEISALESGEMIFSEEKCSHCGHLLKPPFTCFMCHHTFHDDCLPKDSNGEFYCSICGPQIMT